MHKSTFNWLELLYSIKVWWHLSWGHGKASLSFEVHNDVFEPFTFLFFKINSKFLPFSPNFIANSLNLNYGLVLDSHGTAGVQIFFHGDDATYITIRLKTKLAYWLLSMKRDGAVINLILAHWHLIRWRVYVWYLGPVRQMFFTAPKVQFLGISHRSEGL